MTDIFSYVIRKYSVLSGQDAHFYELFSNGIHKRIIMEIADSVEKKKKDINDRIIAWEQRLDSSYAAVTRIQSDLDVQHRQYNFVGLSRAFSGLLKRKRIESYVLLSGLFIVAALILCIPFEAIANQNFILNFLSSVFSAEINNGKEAASIYGEIGFRVIKGLPFVAIEVALVYYFRVLLGNYYNVKSQIVQLELRNSLCQFIESYVDFAKKHDEKTIGRFESLIFSDIERPTANVPAPIDLEQLVTLLKAGKS